ncbi:MAG TPA: hypothetical protein VHH73_11975 [Verrucomicrobiae bacterium]|nr:hypothetical protein [Verrucomicrobiae bacterium]
MKAKVFEVLLNRRPSGPSPATALEEQLNRFLGENPDIHLVSTQMSTLVSPGEPNSMANLEETFIIIFCTLFYTT